MNINNSILLSAFMLMYVSSECFQITESSACGGFSGSYIASTPDFKDVNALNSFVQKRVGSADSNKLYIDSFRSSYGCKSYFGGRQGHLQTMFCVQLIVGSSSICKKPISAPLCSSTCQAAVSDLVSLFQSPECATSPNDKYLDKIHKNRNSTMTVYNKVCSSSAITSSSSGCVRDALSLQSSPIAPANQLPQQKFGLQGLAIQTQQPVASKPQQPVINQPQQVASQAQQVASQPQEQSANQPQQPVASKPQEPVINQPQEPVASQPQQVASEPQQVASQPQEQSASQPQHQVADSESNNKNIKASASPQDGQASPDQSQAGSSAPPADGQSQMQGSPSTPQNAANSIQSVNPESNPSPVAPAASVESPALASLAESGNSQSDSTPPPPAAEAEIPNEAAATDSPQSGSGTQQAQNVEGGDSASSKTTIWIIVGVSVGLILAAFTGYAVYKRRQAGENADNPFKGNINSIGSLGTGTPNTLVKDNEGLVSRPYYPELPDELELKLGDRVGILEAYDDGWALGDNITSGGRGIFPLQCLEPVTDATNPNPSSRISSLYSINKFYTKE